MRTFIPLLCLLAILTGCSTAKRFGDLPDTFLEDVDLTAKRPNLPFDHSWVAGDVKRGTYSGIYIKPVRIDTLPEDAWKRSVNLAIVSKEGYEKTAQDIATYFDKELREQMLEKANKRFVLDDHPGPQTIVLEIALTELEFSQPIIHAGALLAPIPAADQAISTLTDPHVAFAARITDGGTGKLLATAADRKFPPTRIIDLNKLTIESSAREVCALWAESITKALNSNESEKISEERFSLLPW